MKPIVLICKDHDWLFFQDYFTSVASYLPIEKRITTFQPSQDYLFLFVLCIPPEVLEYRHVSFFYLNTEQLTKEKWRIQVKSYLDANIHVIDYDEAQSKMFDSPYHLYLPVLPLPMEHFISPVKQFDVGICAIRASKRRFNMFQALRQRNIRVIDINQWGDERDRTIGQCRILLNIHYDEDYQVFEHLRCDRWLFSGHCIVSETSQSDDTMDLSPLVYFTSYEKMVDTVLDILHGKEKQNETFDILALSKERKHHAERTMEQIRNIQ
jgi:hypothetical protein